MIRQDRATGSARTISPGPRASPSRPEPRQRGNDLQARSVAGIEVTAEDPREALKERVPLGAAIFSAANPRAASSAPARVRSTPPRHNTARSRAAHASADRSAARAPGPCCRRSTASAHRSAWPARRPDRRGDNRGPHGGHRMPLAAAPLTQPPDRPPEGGDPALLVGQQRQAVPQLSSLIDVPGGDGVLRRCLDEVVAQPPGAARRRRPESDPAPRVPAPRAACRGTDEIRKRRGEPDSSSTASHSPDPSDAAPPHGRTTCSTPGYSTRSDGSGRPGGLALFGQGGFLPRSKRSRSRTVLVLPARSHVARPPVQRWAN